mmetsp:Transcript_24383/g.57935  ORF Transcript_24383/g.57935 Transcript_24383/m.57935 type:complete len:290 (-) Transcript_24383:196-1065(-)
MALGTKNDLIRPVRREMDSTRRAGAAAAASVLLLVACAGLYLNNTPAQQSLAEISPATAAEEAAKHSEQQVAHFMEEMKEVKAPKKISDKHALDWNWGPELARDKRIPNWVGSEFVKPLRNAARIRPIASPQKDSAAGTQVTALPVHPTVATVPAATVGPAQGSEGRGEARLPSMLPLRFFAHEGLPPLDARDIIKAAQRSVATVAANHAATHTPLVHLAPVQRLHAEPAQQQTPASAAPPQPDPAQLSVASAEAEKARLEAKAEALQQRIQQASEAVSSAPSQVPPQQ